MHLRQFRLCNLHHCADLLAEQRAEQLLAIAGELQRSAQPASEDHFSHGREQAAIAAVMVGEQHAALVHFLDGREEIDQ